MCKKPLDINMLRTNFNVGRPLSPTLCGIYVSPICPAFTSNLPKLQMWDESRFVVPVECGTTVCTFRYTVQSHIESHRDGNRACRILAYILGPETSKGVHPLSVSEPFSECKETLHFQEAAETGENTLSQAIFRACFQPVLVTENGYRRGFFPSKRCKVPDPYMYFKSGLLTAYQGVTLKAGRRAHLEAGPMTHTATSYLQYNRNFNRKVRPEYSRKGAVSR